MANIKISELPAAAAANGTQEFETNDSGTSKKVTGSQLKTFVKNGFAVADVSDLTATASELNTLDGITASVTELNTLDGLTASTTELNYLTGVSANVQTQLDTKYESGDVATQAQAEAGTDNLTVMTPLRTAQAIASLGTFTKEYTSPNQTIISASSDTMNHGLGEVPKVLQLELVCVTAESNYSVGDVIIANMNSTTSGTNRHNSVYATSTQIIIRYSSVSTCFTTADKVTGASVSLTNSNWRFRVRAYA